MKDRLITIDITETTKAQAVDVSSFAKKSVV
jgi:hypothetical protein